MINLINSNFIHFLDVKASEIIDSLFWVYCRCALLWNLNERREYRQFFEIKELSLGNATSEKIELIKEKILILCDTISDDSIAQHLKRLDYGGGLNDQAYFKSHGEEKAVIKAHEVFEMLSMKWEFGVSYNRARWAVFRPAHLQAIKIENIFYQALAHEKKIPLSQRALEYCRICDDRDLTSPMRFYYDSTGSYSLNIKITEENLTENIQKIPQDPDEIDRYCSFFSQFMNHWDRRYRIGLSQRFLFSQLSQLYPNKKNLLIALLRALEKEDIYHQFSLKMILETFKDHLEHFSLPLYDEEYLLKDKHLFVKSEIEIPFIIQEQYIQLRNKMLYG